MVLLIRQISNTLLYMIYNKCDLSEIAKVKQNEKTLTAVLLVLFILTLFTACGENKDHSDTESSAGTNNNGYRKSLNNDFVTMGVFDFLLNENSLEF